MPLFSRASSNKSVTGNAEISVFSSSLPWSGAKSQENKARGGKVSSYRDRCAVSCALQGLLMQLDGTVKGEHKVPKGWGQENGIKLKTTATHKACLVHVFFNQHVAGV